MRPEHNVFRYEKCILHISRWMLLGQIQCGKVVPVILNFWTIRQSKSDSTEDIYDFIQYER